MPWIATLTSWLGHAILVGLLGLLLMRWMMKADVVETLLENGSGRRYAMLHLETD